MRLTPESLKVETFATCDLPEQVGAASSDTGYMDCSGGCDQATCIMAVCD